MKILFNTQDLSDLMKKEYADPDEETRENRKKDSKILFFI